MNSALTACLVWKSPGDATSIVSQVAVLPYRRARTRDSGTVAAAKAPARMRRSLASPARRRWVGALVVSPFTKGGTWSTTPCNRYSLLASIEDTFGLPYLGYAGTPGLNRFGLDVYNAKVYGRPTGRRRWEPRSSGWGPIPWCGFHASMGAQRKCIVRGLDEIQRGAAGRLRPDP
jgi:hypothetical protein